MRYVDYLQYGGQAPLELSDEEQMAQDQLRDKQMLSAFKEDPQGFIQNMAGGEDPLEIVNLILSKAVELKDEEAYKIIAPLAEELGIAQRKCGGNIRSKVKKADAGASVTFNKCGSKVKKTKKCAEGGELALDFSMIDFAKCGKKLQKKEVGGKVAEEKCGGKAKKVKKAEIGAPHGIKKEWKDSSYSVTNFSKGGCPCQLKKVGGKIITVDSCTGLPMKKNGGDLIKKYENTPGPITYNKLGRNYTYNGLEYEYSPATKTWSGFDPNKKGVLSTLSSGDLYNRLNDARNFYTKSNGSEYLKNDDGTYSKYGSDAVYRLMSANGKNYYTTGGNGATWNGSAWLKNGQTMTIDEKGNISWTGNPNTWTSAKGNVYTKGADGYYTSNLADLNGYKFQLTSDGNFMRGNWGADDAVWDAATNNWKREGYDLTTKGWKAILPENTENSSSSGAGTSELTAGQRMFLNNGAKELGDMTWLERKLYLTTGAGKDLQGLGFDVTKYTGSPEQNRALLAAWKAKQSASAYDPTKQALPANASEAQIRAYEEAKLNGTAFGLSDAERAGRSFATAADRSNKALLGLDLKSALYLGNADYARWLALKRDLNFDNGAKATSLTFNGKTYADENAYNAAVGAYNLQLLQNLMQAMSLARGRRGRNAVMNDSKYALASNYQAPTLKLGETQLSGTEYKKQGGLISYSQYLK